MTSWVRLTPNLPLFASIRGSRALQEPRSIPCSQGRSNSAEVARIGVKGYTRISPLISPLVAVVPDLIEIVIVSSCDHKTSSMRWLFCRKPTSIPSPQTVHGVIQAHRCLYHVTAVGDGVQYRLPLSSPWRVFLDRRLRLRLVLMLLGYLVLTPSPSESNSHLADLRRRSSQ